MPPKRKRAAAGEAAVKKAVKKKAPAKGVEGLFNYYKEAVDGEADVIGPEGVERMCTDIALAPSDRRVLVFAWLTKAERMGFFTKEEFRRGCSRLSVTSLAQLKKSLPKLDAAIANPTSFASFYSFAFDYCLTDPGQKIIDVETAAEMLQIALPDGRFVPAFCEFLTTQTDYKKLNSDQWNNFLKFSREVALDFSNAEDNPAWPVLLDNFVEWASRRQLEES